VTAAASRPTQGRRCRRPGRYPGRDGFTGADLDMAVSFGTHAAVALALAEARDTQISDARLEDHDRIAFDMHDHVMGELFALGMGLQGLAATTRNPAHAERINTYVAAAMVDGHATKFAQTAGTSSAPAADRAPQRRTCRTERPFVMQRSRCSTCRGRVIASAP
jgi:hypothetical protein